MHWPGIILAPSLLAKGGAPAGPVATPTATHAPRYAHRLCRPDHETPVPDPDANAFPGIHTAVTAVPTTVVQNGIPPAGVWVRIMYAGNFSGSVGASGRMTAVTGSGDQLYQIPAKNEIVEAAVQKLDGSGNPLTVIFYNDGVVVKTGTTSSPNGSLDLHADLRSTEPVTAAGNTTVGNLIIRLPEKSVILLSRSHYFLPSRALAGQAFFRHLPGKTFPFFLS